MINLPLNNLGIFSSLVYNRCNNQKPISSFPKQAALITINTPEIEEMYT